MSRRRSRIIDQMRSEKQAWEKGRNRDLARSLAQAAGRQPEPIDGLALVAIQAQAIIEAHEQRIAEIDMEMNSLRAERGEKIRSIGNAKSRLDQVRRLVAEIR